MRVHIEIGLITVLEGVFQDFMINLIAIINQRIKYNGSL